MSAMYRTQTTAIVAGITDEGLFESLMTAILRKSNSKYASIVHTGLNDAGRTVKAPVDGITYETGANPSHLIAVHHTIASRSNLRKKWLHDTSTVTPRTNKGPTSVDGDLVKTAKIFAAQRLKESNLRATLVVSTIFEPDEPLIHDINAFATQHSFALDIWGASRIADFLDNTPEGQWLRREYLNIDADLLSRELLFELCNDQFANYPISDDPQVWIKGSSYEATKESVNNPLTFLIGESGIGKSAACYQVLETHIANGGAGLIIDESAILSSTSLEDAFATTLRQSYLRLSPQSEPVTSLLSPENPLLVIVEDVNRSAFPDRILEKLISWNNVAHKAGREEVHKFRIICPISPMTIMRLKDQTQKAIGKYSTEIKAFDEAQGEAAVLKRAKANNQSLSPLDARRFSAALGHDPLLIALSDFEQAGLRDPRLTISKFVETAIQRMVSNNTTIMATELRGALLSLGTSIVLNRSNVVYWEHVRTWKTISTMDQNHVSLIARDGAILRISGNSDKERISFRHDRVENQILADSMHQLWRKGALEEAIRSDPYFAEILGIAISTEEAETAFIEDISGANPLALFVAFQRFGDPRTENQQLILRRINDWLENSDCFADQFWTLRQKAILALSATDSRHVTAIARKFPDESDSKHFAMLRNGELIGALNICLRLEPGVGATWRDIQFEHAKLKHGSKLIQELAGYLQRDSLEKRHRIAALRYAGHLAESELRESIQTCWNNDNYREEHLAEYLWAFAQCCGDNAFGYLEQVCTGWANLPDDPIRENDVSPRVALIQYSIRWAFGRWPPINAIEYFIQRAAQPDLSWAITILLDGMDEPRAMQFAIKKYAEIDKRVSESGGFSPFLSMSKDKWRPGRRSDGRTMSNETRLILEQLWQSGTNDKHVRRQALSVWELVSSHVDLESLRNVSNPDEISNEILRIRIRWRDKTALPELLERLNQRRPDFWWRLSKYIWNEELRTELGRFMQKRGDAADARWIKGSDLDYLMAEVFYHIPVTDVEYLLCNYWDNVKDSPNFIQAALYQATDKLLSLVDKSVKESSNPKRYFMHISMHFGIRESGHPGIKSRVQLEALRPYVKYLEPMDIKMFWDACNQKQWFDLRDELFDAHLLPEYKPRFGNKESIFGELNRLKSSIGYPWVEHLLEEIMNTGISWLDVVAALREWVSADKTIKGVSLVSNFIRLRGTRNDLNVFDAFQGDANPHVQSIIADARYAVYARSLS